MASKGERQSDRALVGVYHEACLSELVERVAAAVDRFRAGEVEAFDVDEVLHEYQGGARELCSAGSPAAAPAWSARRASCASWPPRASPSTGGSSALGMIWELGGRVARLDLR